MYIRTTDDIFKTIPNPNSIDLNLAMTYRLFAYVRTEEDLNSPILNLYYLPQYFRKAYKTRIYKYKLSVYKSMFIVY